MEPSLPNFTAVLGPLTWVWWTAAFLYNQAFKAVQACAPALKPYQGLIRKVWGIHNIALAVFSLLSFYNTYR